MRKVGDTWVLREDDGTEINMVVITVDEENMTCQSVRKTD